MLLDFEPDVIAFSSQPLYLRWRDRGRVRRHPPNYFARRDIGRSVVLDVRARERVEEMDSEVFAATERACTMVGWDFRRKDVLDPIFAVHLRWLARYRHPRCRREPYAARLIDVFAEPGRPQRHGPVGNIVRPRTHPLRERRRLGRDDVCQVSLQCSRGVGPPIAGGHDR
jgi:hypothetical protein